MMTAAEQKGKTAEVRGRRRETEKAAARFLSNRAAAVGLLVLAVIVVLTILPGIVTRFDPVEMDLSVSLLAPSAEHPFGTGPFEGSLRWEGLTRGGTFGEDSVPDPRPPCRYDGRVFRGKNGQPRNEAR
jgi:hypothetical protein